MSWENDKLVEIMGSALELKIENVKLQTENDQLKKRLERVEKQVDGLMKSPIDREESV